MRIGFVVAADRYTGAAAVAELMCRSVQAAGSTGTLLFVGGRNLEHRLKGRWWAHPDLVKGRSPAGLAHNLRRIRRFARDNDVVICHLPHDHFLCVAAGVHRTVPLVRSVRHPKHLRTNPWQRWLHRRVRGNLLAHSRMKAAAGRGPVERTFLVLPVPVEDRFHLGVKPGPWREWLGIPGLSPILGMVGKVAEDRGFNLLLETARHVDPPVHLIAIGHGEALADLQKSAVEAGLEGRVHWLGYRDNDLPELYATMDVALFAAAGSDHGHRAVSEAQACGRPVIAASIDGVTDLIQEGVTGRIVDANPVALSAAVTDLLRDQEVRRSVGRAASRAVEDRRMAAVGSRLVRFIGNIIEGYNR